MSASRESELRKHLPIATRCFCPPDTGCHSSLDPNGMTNRRTWPTLSTLVIESQYADVCENMKNAANLSTDFSVEPIRQAFDKSPNVGVLASLNDLVICGRIRRSKNSFKFSRIDWVRVPEISDGGREDPSKMLSLTLPWKNFRFAD